MSVPAGKSSDKNKRFPGYKANDFVNKNRQNDNSKVAVRPQSGYQSLGKITTQRIPPPAHLPSLRSEHGSGFDANIPIVPSGSHGWTNQSGGLPSSPNTTATNQNVPSTTTTTSANIQIQNRPTTPAKSQSTPQDSSTAAGAASTTVATSKTATWSTITAGTGHQIEPPNIPNLRDFPHLSTLDGKSMTNSTMSGNNVLNKKPQNDQSSSPSSNNNVLTSLTNSNTTGPSLRPANIASWREGGGRAQPLQIDQKDTSTNDLLSRSQQEYAANNLNIQNSSSLTTQNNQLVGNGPAGLLPPQMSPSAQFLRMYPPQHPQMWGYPPYGSYGLPFGGPSQMSVPMHRQPFGVSATQMHQYQSHHQQQQQQQQTQRRDQQQIDTSDYKSPNILHQKELDALTKLTDNDTWANAPQSVDYGEKLQFSDSEDNGETTSKSEQQTRQRTNIQQQQAPYYTQRQNSDSGYSQSRYNNNRQSNQQVRQQTQAPHPRSRLIQDDDQWKQLQEKTNTELQNTLAVAKQRRAEEERKLDADAKKKISAPFDDEQQQRRETDSKSPSTLKQQQKELNTSAGVNSGSKQIPGYQTRPLLASTSGNGNSQSLDSSWPSTTSRNRRDTNESQTFSMPSWHEQMESFNYASLHEKEGGVGPTESDHDSDTKKYSRSHSESSSRSQSQVGIPVMGSRNDGVKSNNSSSIPPRQNRSNNTEQQRDIVDYWDVGTLEHDKDNDDWENWEDNAATGTTNARQAQQQQSQRGGIKIQQDPFADVDTTAKAASNRYRQQQQNQSNIDKRNNFQQQNRGSNNRNPYNTQSSREESDYGRKSQSQQQSERNNSNNISTMGKSKSRLQIDSNSRQQQSSGGRGYSTDNSKPSTPDARSVNNEFQALTAPQKQNSSNQKNHPQQQRETTEIKATKQPWKSLSPTRMSDHDSDHLMPSSKDPTPSEAVVLKSQQQQQQQRDSDNRSARNDDQQQYQYTNQQQRSGKPQTRFNQQNTSMIQPLMSLLSDTKHLRSQNQQSQQQRQQSGRHATRDVQYQQQERRQKDYDQRSQSQRMTQNDYYGQDSGEYEEYEYEEYDTQGYHHPGVNTRQGQQQMRHYPQLHHHRGYTTLGTYGRYRRGGRQQYGSISAGSQTSSSGNISNTRTKKYSTSRTTSATTTKPVSTTQHSLLSKQNTTESTSSIPATTTEQLSSPSTQQQPTGQNSSTTKSTPPPKQTTVQQNRKENAWGNNTNITETSSPKNVQASIDITNGSGGTTSVDAIVKQQSSSLNEQIPPISDETEQKSISTTDYQKENKSQASVSTLTGESIVQVSTTHTPTDGNTDESPQTNESKKKNLKSQQQQQQQQTNNHRDRYNDQRQPPRYRSAYARNMQQEYQSMQSTNNHYGRQGRGRGRMQVQDNGYYYEQPHAHRYNRVDVRYGNQFMGGQDNRGLNTRGRGRGSANIKSGNVNLGGNHRSSSGVVGTSDTITSGININHQSFVNGSVNRQRGSQISLSANSTDDKEGEEDWETASESSAKMRNGNNYERSGSGAGLNKERENITLMNDKLGNGGHYQGDRTPPRKSYSSQRPLNNRYPSGYNDNRRYYSYDRSTTQKSGRGTSYKAQQHQPSLNEQNRLQQQSTIDEAQSQKQPTPAATGSTTNSQQLQQIKKDYRHSVEGYDLNNVAGVVKIETLPAGALEEEDAFNDGGEEFSVVRSRKGRKEQKAAQLLRQNAVDTKEDSLQQQHDQVDNSKLQQQRATIPNSKQTQDTSQITSSQQDAKSLTDVNVATDGTSTSNNDVSGSTNVNDTASSSRNRTGKSVPPRFNSKSAGGGQYSSSSYYYDRSGYYYDNSYDNHYYNSYDSYNTIRQGRNYNVSKQNYSKNKNQRHEQKTHDENQREKKNEPQQQSQIKTNTGDQLGLSSIHTANSKSMENLNSKETSIIQTTNNTLPNVMTNIQMWDNSIVNDTSPTTNKIIEKPSSMVSSFPNDKKFGEHSPNESSNKSGELSLPHHQRTAVELGSEPSVGKTNEMLARTIKPPVSEGKQARDKTKSTNYEKNDSMSLDSNQLFPKEVNFMADYDDKNTPGDDYNQKINSLKTLWDTSDHSSGGLEATTNSMISRQKQEKSTNAKTNDSYSQLDNSNSQRSQPNSSSNVNVSSSSSGTIKQQGSNTQDDGSKQLTITPASSATNINPNNSYSNQNIGTKNEQKNICTVKPTQQVAPNIQDSGNVVDIPFPTFAPPPMPQQQQQIIPSISSSLAPPQSMQQQTNQLQQQHYAPYPYDNTLLPQQYNQNRYPQNYPFCNQAIYMSSVPNPNSMYHHPHSQQSPISAAPNNSMPPHPPPMNSFNNSSLFVLDGTVIQAPPTQMMNRQMMSNRNIQPQPTNPYYSSASHQPPPTNAYNTPDTSTATGPSSYQPIYNQNPSANAYSQRESYSQIRFHAPSNDRNDYGPPSMIPLQPPPPSRSASLQTQNFLPMPTPNQPSLAQSQNPPKYQQQQPNLSYPFQSQFQYGGNGNRQQQHQQGLPGSIGNINRSYGGTHQQQSSNIGPNNKNYISFPQPQGNNNNNVARSRPILPTAPNIQPFIGDGSGNNQKSASSLQFDHHQMYNQQPPQLHYSNYAKPHP